MTGASKRGAEAMTRRGEYPSAAEVAYAASVHRRIADEIDVGRAG